MKIQRLQTPATAEYQRLRDKYDKANAAYMDARAEADEAGLKLAAAMKSGAATQDTPRHIARPNARPMTPEEYRTARKARGTQTEVAALLGVRQSTISDRETGRREITREAELALRSLTAPGAAAKPAPRPT